MKNRDKTRAMPFPFYAVPVFLLALAGFFDSVYLSFSHFRVYTDLSYKSFCAISKAINCDTVSQSPYSIFLGVPVPVWGVLGYLFAIFLIIFAWKDFKHQRRGWSAFLLVASLFSTYSVILALISNYLIHSYCIMCIASYAVNLGLLTYAIIIKRRFLPGPFLKGLADDLKFFLFSWKRAVTLGMFGVAAAAMILWFPPYWHMNYDSLDTSLPHGMTEDGHPWIGAASPELTIVEYTDYMCFQCRKMHVYLRKLVEAYPEKIRLVHKHFPMDNKVNPIVKEPFHVGAAKLARIAVYAAAKGKFWETNDFLFSIPKKDINIKAIAKAVGLEPAALAWALKSREVGAVLNRDILDGLKLGIAATPSYEINGQVYTGIIPPDVIRKVIKG